MKNLIIFFQFILMSVTAIAQNNSSNTEYSAGGNCSCSSLTCHASKSCSVRGYSCTCTCTLTICSCTGCSVNELVVDDIIVTEQHIRNRKELVQLLNSFGSAQSKEIANLIEKAYEALERKDIKGYLSNGTLAEENLHTLPSNNKSAINDWAAIKGSTFRL